MIKPKIPQRPQSNVKVHGKIIIPRKSPIDQGRSISPLSQFTNFILDDIEPPQSCRPQKNSMQSLTPPLISTPSARLSKECLKKNYSLSYKCLAPSGKKKQLESSILSNAYHTQQHPIISYHQQNIIQNSNSNNINSINTAINNDSAVKSTSMHTFTSDSKNKQCKENINAQYIYGLGKSSPNKFIFQESLTNSKGKIVKMSVKSDDHQKRDNILTQISTNNILQRQTQPFTCEDDQDLYYQIVKQRTKIIPVPKGQLSCKSSSTPNNQCQNHQSKRGKYYIKENNSIILLCSKCSIMCASENIVIYDAKDHQKLTRETETQKDQEKWKIKAQIDDSCEQKTKVSEMQTFLYRTQNTHKIGHSLLDILIAIKKDSSQNITNLIAFHVMDYLKEPIQDYIDERVSLKEVPCDVMVEIQDQVNEMLVELGSIKNDINQNIPNIIKNMEMKPFRLILQKYYLKVEAFESNLNELLIALDKNFGLPNIYEMVENLKTQIGSSPQKKQQSQTKQVYISFENKESFLKAKQDCQSPPLIYQTNDSILLGSSETQKFLDFLHRDAEDQNRFNEQSGQQTTRPFDQKNLLLSPNFNHNDQFD